MLNSSSKEKERSLSFLCCWYLVLSTKSNSPNIHQRIETIDFGINQTPISRELTSFYTSDVNKDRKGDSFTWNGIGGSDVDIVHPPPVPHPCDSFSFPPPPPPGLRRPGPCPCPVCYLSPEEALASMPKRPFESPVLKNLTYIREENPVKPVESQGGSDFGGYPSLEHRSNSFDIKEFMTIC